MTTNKTVSTSARAAEKKVPAKSSVKKAPAKKTPVKKAATVAKAAAKPAVKPAAKPVVKPATKPAAKPVLKPLPAAAAKPAAKKPRKEQKIKVVRDSFTMPQNEYQKIAEIKDICMKAGLPVKKSEVLRAGLKALAAMKAAPLKRALAELEKIKTGRPRKH